MELFAESSQDFWQGVGATLVAVISALATWHIAVRKDTRSDEDADRLRKSKEEDKLSKEYKRLFMEVKEELAECRQEHRRSSRRSDRLEAAMLAAGIKLPSLPPDEGSDGHESLQEGNDDV